MSTPTHNLRLLLVEDQEFDAELTLLRFERAALAVTHERVVSAEDLRDALARGGWDAIICDNSLPGLDAPEALEIVKASGGRMPFIVLSGSLSEEESAALLARGAKACILKDEQAKLVTATLGAIEESRREGSS